MRRQFLKLVVRGFLASGVLGAVSRLANAGLLCCQHCGCSKGCRKTCRLVQEDRKVTKVCWGCECEDFALPGPSCPGCRHCETVCDDCANPKVHARPQKLAWTEWKPGRNAHIYTKKKLMKRTVTKTVPGFKWVVEDLCPACEAASPSVEAPPGAVVPPPPKLPRP